LPSFLLLGLGPAFKYKIAFKKFCDHSPLAGIAGGFNSNIL
jgi:hypothetical protein